MPFRTRIKGAAAFTLLLLIVMMGHGAAAPLPPPKEPISRFYLPLFTVPRNERHGLAWSYRAQSPDAWDVFKVDWYYHWAYRPTSGVPASVQFVPMIWGDAAALKTAFLLAVPSSYCGPILFANEPEFPDQSNMTIERVVALLEWLIEHYPCAHYVGPQSHVCWYELKPPSGTCPSLGPRFTVEGFIVAWRNSHQGNNPPIHAYGLHYGNVLYWPDRITSMLRGYGIEPRFWYTEFNHCSESEAQFRIVMDYLNRHPAIERYAYWTNLRDDNLCALSDWFTGDATWRGRLYAGYGE
jgi:hypothetical protein